MGRRQPVGKLNPQTDDFALMQPPSLDSITDRRAMDQFHDEKIHTSLCVKVENGRDVRMVELREGYGFASETFAACFISEKTGRKNLYSDVTLEVFIMGAIDLGHTSRSDFVLHDIMAEFLADHHRFAPGDILLRHGC